jgi:hypothetical protein
MKSWISHIIIKISNLYDFYGNQTLWPPLVTWSFYVPGYRCAQLIRLSAECWLYQTFCDYSSRRPRTRTGYLLFLLALTMQNAFDSASSFQLCILPSKDDLLACWTSHPVGLLQLSAYVWHHSSKYSFVKYQIRIIFWGNRSCHFVETWN